MNWSKPIQPPASRMAWAMRVVSSLVKIEKLVMQVMFVVTRDCQRSSRDHACTPATSPRPMKPDPSQPIDRPVVLVTGAARRLGREIALTLAAGGWQVAVHYRSSAADAMKTVADCSLLSGASAALDADLADEAAVRGLLPRVVAHFGRVDAVVNNASTFAHDTAASFSFAGMDQH